MENNFKTIFFIHIPKTGGTSFRKEAEKVFNSEKIVYDYAEKSAETHPKIIEFEYQKKDRFLSGNYIKNNADFFSGHVSISKYSQFIDPRNIITFIRSPEQQIRSHFEHYIRHHDDFQGTFKEFIVEKRFSNLQSRMLRGADLESIGFIGITEKYNASIELINKLYELNIEISQKNLNPDRESEQYKIAEDEMELIIKHNQEDFLLYQFAINRFKKQQDAIINKKPFIRSGLNKLPQKLLQTKINGWVTNFESSDALALDVTINGEFNCKIISNQFYAAEQGSHKHRNGYIGFSYQFPKNIKKGDKIEISENSTNEILFSVNYPRQFHSGYEALLDWTKFYPNKKGKLAIAAIFRNEKEYILEWIAWHRSQGISDFIIYDNDSDDGTTKLLEKLTALKIIQLFNIPRQTNPQAKAYENIINDFITQYELIAFIDADEFIVPQNNKTAYNNIFSLFNNDKSIGALGINWKIFGSSHYNHKPDGNVLDSFIHAAYKKREGNHPIKSIYRPEAIKNIFSHRANLNLNYKYISSSGEPIIFSDQNNAPIQNAIRTTSKSTFVCDKNLRIHHYAVKSKEEFNNKKKAKGDAFYGQDRKKGDHYFKSYDLNDYESKIPETHLEKFYLELEKLKLKLK